VREQSHLNVSVRAFYAEDAVAVFQIKIGLVSRKSLVDLIKQHICVHLVTDVRFKYFYHIPECLSRKLPWLISVPGEAIFDSPTRLFTIPIFFFSMAQVYLQISALILILQTSEHKIIFLSYICKREDTKSGSLVRG
jgi:hypothetical protein